MTEMEERVARALCALEDDPDRIHSFTGEPMWKRHVTEASTAFKVLRLPTREMLEAADAAGSPESPALPHEVWPAMIDAAIGK